MLIRREPKPNNEKCLDAADTQASLEAVLKDEIINMYQEVADNPGKTFHFFHGREAAELFGYPAEWPERAPEGAVASFAGVGNPHERADLEPGETVLDPGPGVPVDGPGFYPIPKDLALPEISGFPGAYCP